MKRWKGLSQRRLLQWPLPPWVWHGKGLVDTLPFGLAEGLRLLLLVGGVRRWGMSFFGLGPSSLVIILDLGRVRWGWGVMNIKRLFIWSAHSNFAFSRHPLPPFCL